MLREMHTVADTKDDKADAKEEGRSSPRPANLEGFSGHDSAPHRTPETPIPLSTLPTQT
jgi:hypothetical protein